MRKGNRWWRFALGLLAHAGISAAAGTQETPKAHAPSPEHAAVLDRFGEALTAAYQNGDAGRLREFYADEARLMVEYQPTMIGRDNVVAYHRAWLARFAVVHVERVERHRIDLGRRIVEDGAFTMRLQARDGGEAGDLKGKYLDIWEVSPRGELRLLTQAWNLDERVAWGDRLRFSDVPAVRTAFQARVPVRDGLSFELAAINRLLETAIVQHDAGVWSLVYADDAVLLPNFAGVCDGRPAIDAYLEAHVKEMPVFEKLDIRNDRIDDLGEGWVIDYASHVANWRSGDSSGVSTGKNVRVWRRMPAGGLRLVRHIGSYD